MTLPSILVTDTNIWIDLENGEILPDVFRLPYQFFTTDFAAQEFIFPSWNTLVKLGLQTHDLEPESIIQLIQLKQVHHQLSTIDLASLLLAKVLGASLITGDRRLSELAKTQGLSVHGVLWLLDELLMHQVLSKTQAARALRKILDRGARLPNIECQKRFESWV